MGRISRRTRALTRDRSSSLNCWKGLPKSCVDQCSASHVASRCSQSGWKMFMKKIERGETKPQILTRERAAKSERQG